MRNILLTLLCASLLSCGGEFGRETCEGSFQVEPALAADAVAARERWNDFLGEKHFHVSTEEGRCHIVIGKIDTISYGHYHPETGEIVIDWGKIGQEPASLRQSVIMHELGHSIGLPHLSAGHDGIMAPASGPQFTEWDRQAVEGANQWQSVR